MNPLFSFCQGTFDWVWKTSIAAAILATLVFLVQWALGKRLMPRLHYALSLLVLVRLLMPALPASSFSLEKFLPQKTRISQPAFHVVPVSNPTAPKPGAVIIANSPAPLPTPTKSSTTLGIFCTLWLLGCLFLVLLATWRYLKWVRWIDEGEIISDPKLLAILDGARKDMRVRRPVKIVAIPQVAGPAVFGVWNIRLLLPENIMRDLSNEDLRLIFRHEMAHVRGYDVLLNTVMMAVQFLHWFNPIIWLALHRIRADRETICDEMVMRHAEAEERERYGRLLLKLIEEFPNGQRLLPNTATMVGSQHEIKRRIIMIKNHGKRHLVGATLACIAIMLLGCATFTHSEASTSPARSSPTPSPERKDIRIVEVSPHGFYLLDHRSMNLEEVSRVLEGQYRANPNLIIAIRVDKNENQKLISDILDRLEKIGITRISIEDDHNTMTQPSPEVLQTSNTAFTVEPMNADGTSPIVYRWNFNTNANSSAGTTPIAVANNSSSTASAPTLTGSTGEGNYVVTTTVSSGSAVTVGSPSNSTPGATVPETVNTTVPAAGNSPVYYQWYTTSNLPIGNVTVVSDSYQAPSLASQLIGTWVLEREDGPQSSPSGVGVRMKNFTGTHWSIIQPDPKTGAIIFNQGGTYKIEGDKYFEHKDFAGENNKGGIGKTGKFTLKIEGDKLIQKGVNNPWNEVWKRVN